MIDFSDSNDDGAATAQSLRSSSVHIHVQGNETLCRVCPMLKVQEAAHLELFEFVPSAWSARSADASVRKGPVQRAQRTAVVHLSRSGNQ